jgi:hypothetical protein
VSARAGTHEAVITPTDHDIFTYGLTAKHGHIDYFFALYLYLACTLATLPFNADSLKRVYILSV